MSLRVGLTIKPLPEGTLITHAHCPGGPRKSYHKDTPVARKTLQNIASQTGLPGIYLPLELLHHYSLLCGGSFLNIDSKTRGRVCPVRQGRENRKAGLMGGIRVTAFLIG